MSSFRIDTDPWIPIIYTDGTCREIGLIDLFRNAQKIKQVSGNPPEVAAIFRFLMAIVHLVETPTTLDEWGMLWKNSSQLMERCASYVENAGEVWDLFHPIHPFAQVVGLKGTENPSHLLMYDAALKNNPILADHSLVKSSREIEPAKLIRGIITTNAFAGSSGGGYRSGSLSMRSVGMLTSNTLAEALILNLLVQHSKPKQYDWKAYGCSHGRNVPNDIAERYLWTSRQYMLQGIGKPLGVDSVTQGPGDELAEEERQRDPMVAMQPDAKKENFIPLRLNADRALWRSAHVLLASAEDKHPLGAIEQIRRLYSRGKITDETPVQLRICSVAGDAKGPKSELWRDEFLPFGFSLLDDSNRQAALERAIDLSESEAKKLRTRLYTFASKYLQDQSDSSPDPDACKRLLTEIASDFSDYWIRLAPLGERIATDQFNEEEWLKEIKEASKEAFRRAIDRLPPSARRMRAEFRWNEAKSEKVLKKGKGEKV